MQIRKPSSPIPSARRPSATQATPPTNSRVTADSIRDLRPSAAAAAALRGGATAGVRALFMGPRGSFGVESFEHTKQLLARIDARAAAPADATAVRLETLSAAYRALGLKTKLEGTTLTATLPGGEGGAPIVLASDRGAPIGTSRTSERRQQAAAAADAALLQGARMFADHVAGGAKLERPVSFVHVTAHEPGKQIDTLQAALPDGASVIRLDSLRDRGRVGATAASRHASRDLRTTLDAAARDLGTDVAIDRTTGTAAKALPGVDEISIFGRRALAEDSIATVRAALETSARLAGLPHTAGSMLEPNPLYRVFYYHLDKLFKDQPPSAAKRRELETIYGAPVIYNPALRKTPDQDDHMPAAPIKMHGAVLHNDPATEPKVFVGATNPEMNLLAEHKKLGDKWEEFLFLSKHAPDSAPLTLRGDLLAKELGLEVPAKNPREFLVAMQKALDERYGRYIIKTRLGFGSDGHLPTHKDRFGDLWDAYQREHVPQRNELWKTVTDPDQRIEYIYEKLPQPEGYALEALVNDPSSVVIQPWVESHDEMRMHIVLGKVLEGATVGRWTKFGHRTLPEHIKGAEAAVTKMLEHAGLPLSFSMDVLAAKDGTFKIVDLNAGLESGMYLPEYDIRICHLITERLLGHETPYLTAFRAFENAPLKGKAQLLEGIDERILRFIKKSETYGYWDQIIDIYAEDVAKRPTRARLLDAWSQMLKLEGVDAWGLYDFMFDPRLAPALRALTADDKKKMVSDLNARDEDSVSAIKPDGFQANLPYDPSNPILGSNAVPFLRATETEYSDEDVAGWLLKKAEVTERMTWKEAARRLRRAIDSHVTTARAFMRRPNPDAIHADEIEKLPEGKRLFTASSGAELLETCRGLR